MKKLILNNKEQFLEDYPNYTYYELGDKYDVSYDTIKKWSDELGLKKTKKISLNNPEQFLEDYPKHTISELCDKYGVAAGVIQRWSAELGLKKIKEIPVLPLEFTTRQMDIINGSMLGDAYISKKYTESSNCCLQEGHGIFQKDYLQWKYDELKPFTYYFQIYERTWESCKDFKNKMGCRLATYKTPLFTQLERLWYLRDEYGNVVLNDRGHRIKIIPHNFKEINPLTLAVWYMDDGHFDFKKRRIVFCTDGYTYDECDFLKNIIKNTYNIKHIKVIKSAENFHIAITRTSFIPFIEIVKNFVPTQDMLYKVDLEKYIVPIRPMIEDDVIELACRMYQNGSTRRQISNELSLNYDTLCSLLIRKLPVLITRPA